MKISIITFHFVNNFGGILQAYALQRFVSESFDTNCEVIDYRCPFIRFTDFVRLFPVTSSFPEILSGIKTMGKRFDRLKKFKSFSEQNFTLTKTYNSYGALKANPPVCDKYIAGSDQIWNSFLTMGVSDAYFLSFVSNIEDKIAYAPSFGTEGIGEKSKKKIKEKLKTFKYLSAREAFGKDWIYEMTGRCVDLLIDPTFLLNKSDWEIVAGKRRVEGEYILLYIMQQDMEVYEYAKQLKEKLGIKMVEISRYGYNPGFVDETIIDVGPQDFLALFRDAAFVCTNSFHGLAYAVIFEKDFCLVPCKRFRPRINHLLRLFNIVPPEESENWKCITPDYDRKAVSEIVAKEREKAIKYLTSSIYGKDEENE